MKALAALVAALLLAGPVEAEPPAGFVMTWQDEFESGPEPSAPAPDRWTYDLGNGPPGLPGWGNQELQSYTASLKNVFVAGGHLHIRAYLQDPAIKGGGPSSARLVTRRGQLPAYGYYEIRALLPCGAGSWPAIWMLGQDGPWPARGEIDIAEWSARYFSPDHAQAALHMPAHYGAKPILGGVSLAKACGGFQTYGLTWTPDRITVGAAGLSEPYLIYDRPKGAGRAEWPFDQPFQMILNLAIGGTLGGLVELKAGPPREMLVDYVRVYQKP